MSQDLESRLDSALKAGDAADRFAQPGSTYELGIAIAQLRHAYKQIVNGEVNDWQSFANGLLGPQIERLERFHQALSQTVAPQGDRVSIVRYLRHVARVEVGTLLGIFGPQARELTDTIAGWVENRLDERWATRAGIVDRETDMKTEARSLLEWLDGWGDGPNWSDASGATVPVVKASLRRVLEYVLLEHGIPGCVHCDGTGRCSHCDRASVAR